MPLITNRCKKHNNAHPETECPFCRLEEQNRRLEASREFFRLCARSKLRLSSGTEIPVEELYQHFRARLLDELHPTLAKLEGRYES